MNEVKTGGNKQALVSIIIATYNAGRFLKPCLESIAKQVIKNLEIVIVDGGSKDDTADIVNEYSDLKISYQSEPDNGIYDALNKGIAKATGRWFYFMGADDRLQMGFSELAIKLKDENTIYYGNSEEIWDNESGERYQLLKGTFNNYRLAKYCMNHQSILYPASAFEKYSYDLKYKIFADYALNIQLWGDSHFKKIYYPINIVNYNMSGYSYENEDELFKADKPKLVRKSMGWIIYLRLIYRIRRDALHGVSRRG